ncbi:MAG: type II CRISPR-associated endonuclease Cas1 [Coriobacteriales bacterium]|jgi:CRISPR/Cas system-associated endonuclease Cas1|nr:type II CRISPR-associated endonuclease Cas1 [Coriobacteriales bacterium]
MATAGFRELIITSKSLVSYSNNWLVIRSYDGVKKIFLDEIEVVIIENPASSITAYSVVEMAKRNIKLVFCDEKHNPISETLPLYGSYDCAAKLKAQTEWSNEAKQVVWQRIITMKISHQAKLLAEIGCGDASEVLLQESLAVLPGDSSNREGMAARIYFNTLFGLDFNRQRGMSSSLNSGAKANAGSDTNSGAKANAGSSNSGANNATNRTTNSSTNNTRSNAHINTHSNASGNDPNDVFSNGLYNGALNYGYAILTSLFNRYVVAAGYSTQLGIFHRGAENQFNLSCDLMEPYRVIVDNEVLNGDMAILDANAKYRLANLIFTEVDIDGACQTLDNAVPIYLRSVFDALDDGNAETILDYEL